MLARQKRVGTSMSALRGVASATPVRPHMSQHRHYYIYCYVCVHILLQMCVLIPRGAESATRNICQSNSCLNVY